MTLIFSIIFKKLLLNKFSTTYGRCYFTLSTRLEYINMTLIFNDWSFSIHPYLIYVIYNNQLFPFVRSGTNNIYIYI